MKKVFRAFTLVELTVVITIIIILSTFVAINLTSAQKKTRDEKRVSDAQILGNALDQYATSHQRKYPCPVSDGCVEGDSGYLTQDIVAGSDIYQKLAAYINPVPTEASTADGFKYTYVYKKDGTSAAIIVGNSETERICNTAGGNLPEVVTNSGVHTCYFVAR